MPTVSEDLIVIIVGAATEKARLPIFSLVLGTKSNLETDYLRVLEISEKCTVLVSVNKIRFYPKKEK